MHRSGIGRFRVRAYDLQSDCSLDTFFKRQRQRVNDRLNDRTNAHAEKLAKARQHYNGSWHLTHRLSGETIHLDLERAPRKSQEHVVDEN